MSTMIGPVPDGVRLIAIADDLLDNFGTRTDDGFALSAEWGEPTPEGWYEPIFTAKDDGHFMVNEETLDLALLEFDKVAVVPTARDILSFIRLLNYGRSDEA